MDVKIEDSWKNVLSEEFNKDYFIKLTQFVKSEYTKNQVYPPGKDIFRSFDSCPFEKVKVIVIGQDPYHGMGQANGLCFSVRTGVQMPPSLVNIFKEIRNDLGKEIPADGDLDRWASQGVLLLNATLTVRANSPGSHQNKGWEIFTDSVISILNQKRENLVFLLWGSYAQKKGELIDREKHFVLQSVHPSPLSASRGFFGNHHFSETKTYLRSKGVRKIEW